MIKYVRFIYDIIIDRGRFGIPDGEYKEEHHIVPKCVGGSNDKGNLVHLYAREHIVAHKILTETFPNHDGIWYAFWQMCNCGKYDDFIAPGEYERARTKCIENMKRTLSKPVEALDPESGQRVLYFKSTMDAKRSGFSSGHISECCRGKKKTHHGYIWRYINEEVDDYGNY